MLDWMDNQAYLLAEQYRDDSNLVSRMSPGVTVPSV